MLKRWVMANTKESFGGRLARCRKSAGWSQGQLAESSGVHCVTISRLERNRSSPDFETLVALSKALGVAAGFLAAPLLRGGGR